MDPINGYDKWKTNEPDPGPDPNELEQLQIDKAEQDADMEREGLR